MLPPGTLKALTGHPNEIVTVVLFAISVGAITAGAPPWAIIAAMALAFGMFHNRCSAAERNQLEMAQLKVNEAVAGVEMIKARHRDLLLSDQPGLPLESPTRAVYPKFRARKRKDEMIDYSQDLSPVLGILIIAAAAWYVRMNVNRRTLKRTRQLEQAAEIMREHARNLEKFLDDPAAPRELKRLLIEVSDAMGERDVVRKMAEWASSRRLDQSVDSPETIAIGEAIDTLGKTRPDLVENLGTAIFTAVVGASLRWPETAAILEQTLPRLVVTPKHNAAIAATATSFRPGMPFSMKPREEAIA